MNRECGPEPDCCRTIFPGQRCRSHPSRDGDLWQIDRRVGGEREVVASAPISCVGDRDRRRAAMTLRVVRAACPDVRMFAPVTSGLMRRITTGWRPFPQHHVLSATAQETLRSSRVPIFHVRLLGAILAALIALTELTGPEPVRRFARSQVDRDDPSIQSTSLAISPAGDQMATTDAAGRVTLRSFKGWEQIERSLNFPGYARVAAFSPDGRSLAAAGIARGVYLWDLSSPTSHAATALPILIRRAGRMMFSPDSRSLAVTTDLDGTILLWDLTRGRERLVLHHPSPVASMAFSPDGLWLATGGRDDRSILLWDLQTGNRRVVLENAPRPYRGARLLSRRGTAGIGPAPRTACSALGP